MPKVQGVGTPLGDVAVTPGREVGVGGGSPARRGGTGPGEGRCISLEGGWDALGAICPPAASLTLLTLLLSCLCFSHWS
jgi:hypothetical protein